MVIRYKKILSILLSVFILFGMFETFSISASASNDSIKPKFTIINGINFAAGSCQNYNEAGKTGWKWDARDHFSYKKVSSRGDQIVYCLELGQDLNTSHTLSDGINQSTYMKNLYDRSKKERLSSTKRLEQYVALAIKHGYHGDINKNNNWGTSKTLNELYNKTKTGYECALEALATQVIIWEITTQARDDNFNLHYDLIRNSISFTNRPKNTMDKFNNYYNNIVSAIKKDLKIPSFAAKTAGDDNVYYCNKYNNGKYNITLTDNNNVLSGFKFSSSATTANGTKFAEFIRSGSNLTINALRTFESNPKTLTLTKTISNCGFKVLGGYKDEEAKHGAQKVAYYVDGNTEINAYVKYGTKNGKIRIEKTLEDANESKSGFNFTFSASNISTFTATTNSDGVIEVTLPVGAYTVKEVLTGKQAAKYNIYQNKDQINGVTLYSIENKTNTYRVYNRMKYVAFQFEKTDAETGSTPQADLNLEATFELYQKLDGQSGIGTKVGTYTTDKSGKINNGYSYGRTNDYPAYDKNHNKYVYTMKETIPPVGYTLNDQPVTLNYNADSYSYLIYIPDTVFGIKNTVKKGTISIHKFSDLKDRDIPSTFEKDAEFEVYLKSAGSYNNAKPKERYIIKTDEQGNGKTKRLPYGVYIVHQTKGIEGTALTPSFEVFIDENNQDKHYTLNNKLFSAYFKIVKVDASTDKPICVSGAEFQIKDKDGNVMKYIDNDGNVTSRFTTDVNGCIITPMELEYGQYTITETKAPYGYVLDPTPQKVTVSSSTIGKEQTENGKINVVRVTIKNERQKATVKIIKKGSTFTGVEKNESQYGDVYSAKYDERRLAGAEFNVVADEDIYVQDRDKTLVTAKGAVVDILVTNENGEAVSTTGKELELGKYYIEETKSPDGHVISADGERLIRHFELKYQKNGNDTPKTFEKEFEFENESQRSTVVINKKLEQNEKFGVGTSGDEYQNIKFGLFANEDITSQDGDVLIPKDGLIEVIDIDRNGVGESQSLFPIASYYVKEISTDPSYILNPQKYEFNLRDFGQDKNIEVKVPTILNSIAYGSIRGQKLSKENPENEAEAGNALSGALMGLFKSTETEFTKANDILTAKSDSIGYFFFNEVPYGNYIIKELEAPANHMLNTDSFEVSVNKETPNVTDVVIVDKQSNAKLTIQKKSKDGKVSGVKFIVYDKETKGQIYYHEFITDKDGWVRDIALDNHIVYVVEEHLPTNSGYQQPEKREVEFNGASEYKISDDPGSNQGAFQNETQFYPLYIHKKAEDNFVKDVKFTIDGVSNTGFSIKELVEKNLIEGYTLDNLDEDGSLVVYTKDDGIVVVNPETNKPNISKGLPEGTYTIHEDMGDPINSRYEVLSDQVINLNVDTEVTFENKLKKQDVKIIKTSNDGNVKGITFNITGNTSATDGHSKHIDENFVTDENGVITATLIAGTYTVSEVENEVTKGYNREEPKIITVDGSDVPIELYFHNVLREGYLTIAKTSENGVVEGITFNVKGETESGQEYNENFVTDEAGIISKKMLAGKYTISEIANEATKGYKLPEPQTITIIHNSDITVPFYNELAKGELKIVKKSEDGVVQGLSFNVKGTTILGEEYDNTFITNDDGVITATLNAGTYTVSEVDNDNSKGYILPESQTVEITADSNKELNFNNILDKGIINIHKISEDNNIANIEFKVTGTTVRGKEIEKSVLTDENGNASVTLEAGTYTVSEAEHDYLKKYILPESQIVEVNKKDNPEQTLTFENKLKKGNLTIVKTSEDKKVSGISFEIKGTTLDGEVYDKIVKTDKNGKINETLLAGSYTVSEVRNKLTKKYVELESQNVVIDNESNIELNFKNKLIKGTLIITKTDVATGKLLPNAGFKIKDASGKVVVKGYTNKKGIAKFKLSYGKYTYEEFDAPKGYKIDTKPHKFEINKDGQVVKAKMTNEKTSTPKSPRTGDIGGESMPLKIMILIMSVGCLVLLSVTKKRGKIE